MTRPPSPVAEAVRRVACPFCGATSGKRCRATRRGRSVTYPAAVEHTARYLAAAAAGHVPLRSGDD